MPEDYSQMTVKESTLTKTAAMAEVREFRIVDTQGNSESILKENIILPAAQTTEMAEAIALAEGYAGDAEQAKIDAEAAEVQTLLYKNAAAAIVSGGPRMPPFADLAALNTANPDHQFTYLTEDNGHWNAWNGTAFESGGVYQTVADYALKTDLSNKVDRVAGKNLFDKNNLSSSSGQLERGTGVITPSPGYSVSDYIPVTPGDSIIANRYAEWTSFGFYNSLKQFIGSSVQWSTLSPSVVPANAAFGRFTIDNSQIDDYQIEKGTASTDYSEYVDNFEKVSYESFSETLKPEIERIIGHLSTLIPSKIRNTEFITVNNGAIVLPNKNGFKIPSGSTGQNSVFSLEINPSAQEIKDFGDNYIIGRWAFKYIGDSLGDSLRMDMGAGGLIGGNANLKRTEDTVNKTIYFECDKFVASSFSISTLCYCIVNNTVALTSDYTIEFVGLSIKEATINDLNPLQKLIGPDVYAEKFRSLYNFKETIITCKRTGTSGIDADFCGLNAIGDALATITDANKNNIYTLLIEGHFLFTDPAQFEYYAFGTAEPTILVGKNYVNFKGVDKLQTVLEIRLPENAVFPEGYTYTDYQPVAFQSNSKIENMTIKGTNCRYVFHIEYSDFSGSELIVENCILINGGNLAGGYSTIFGTGGGQNYNWTIRNCQLKADYPCTAFAYHTKLNYVTDGDAHSTITFDNCESDTSVLISASPYSYNRQDVINIINHKNDNPLAVINFGAEASPRLIGTILQINTTMSAIPAAINASNGSTLRIKTTAGTSSSIRIDETCTAFNLFGDALKSASTQTDWSAIKCFGYEYKDDANGANSYAMGYENINPISGISLGARLGDCSGTNKTLTTTINGTEYNVVFSTDLTYETNANIIIAINAVIGSVANCDTYNPEWYMWPHYDNMQYNITNADTETILKGMGVIFTGISSIRRAKQTDAKIDGVTIDTIHVGQKGRITKCGTLYNIADTSSSVHLNIYPTLANLVYGDLLSIDPLNDGQFIEDDTAPVMMAISNDIVKFMY